MPMECPFSAACVRNGEPIFKQLLKCVRANDKVLLEIGSGTGQHAVYMAPRLTAIKWYPTDTSDKLAAIEQWREIAQCDRIQAATAYQVGENDWPLATGMVDIVYTANTFHIMSAELVVKLIQQPGENLSKNSRFVIYGPFKYGGDISSESNRDFDQQLKATAAHQGIRDFEWLDALLHQAGFGFVSDSAMPANNQLIVYVKNT